MGLTDQNEAITRDGDYGKVLVPATQESQTGDSVRSSSADAEGDDDPDPIQDWDFSPTSHSSRLLRSPTRNASPASRKSKLTLATTKNPS